MGSRTILRIYFIKISVFTFLKIILVAELFFFPVRHFEKAGG